MYSIFHNLDAKLNLLNVLNGITICRANNDLYVPEKPRKKCTGFSYIGPKLYNMVPKSVKDAKTTDDFKNKLKGWIWENIH